MVNTNEFYDQIDQDEAPVQTEPHQPELSDLMTYIEPSKANVSMLASRIQMQVSEGRLDPIAAAIHLNTISQMCDEALKLIRPDVLDELEKSGGKAGKYQCKVERAEVATKYDFTANPSWNAFVQTEKETAAERKALEDRLKSIPAGKEMADTETGEVFIGPAKVSTTSFKVTLAK